MSLGHKIRDLRLRKGMTVQQLGDATGLSKGFISQVENSHTKPSLTTLNDLAAALGTSVAYLVAQEEQAPHVVRRADRRRLEVRGNTSRVEVVSAQPRRNLEVVIAELPPGLTSEGKRHFHHVEECIVCLAGRLRFTCGEHVVILEDGDACHFDGRNPHAVENVGESLARVLIAVTPAAFEPMYRVKQSTRDSASGSASA
jgi:transcriptional regulator with XRE-family HTH domain